MQKPAAKSLKTKPRSWKARRNSWKQRSISCEENSDKKEYIAGEGMIGSYRPFLIFDSGGL